MGQIAHLNECIQVLSICQILQETEEECKDTDKVVVIYFEDGEYKYIVEDSIKAAQETLIKSGVDRVLGRSIRHLRAPTCY